MKAFVLVFTDNLNRAKVEIDIDFWKINWQVKTGSHTTGEHIQLRRSSSVWMQEHNKESTACKCQGLFHKKLTYKLGSVDATFSLCLLGVGLYAVSVFSWITVVPFI